MIALRDEDSGMRGLSAGIANTRSMAALHPFRSIRDNVRACACTVSRV